jgi:hypothetical protein
MENRDWITAKYSDLDVAVGDFSNASWQKAEPVFLNRYWSGESAPSSRHAEARLIWTDQALLARFACNQFEPSVTNPAPRTNRKTIRLWDRDVCELFLIPDPNRSHEYFEFEAAPTGEWLDIALTTTADGRVADWDYTSGMTTASELSETNFVTVIRIPWAGPLQKPKVGDGWRVNLCRCVGTADDRGYLAWRPTFADVPNFHITSAFGRLLFE